MSEDFDRDDQGLRESSRELVVIFEQETDQALGSGADAGQPSKEREVATRRSQVFPKPVETVVVRPQTKDGKLTLIDRKIMDALVLQARDQEAAGGLQRGEYYQVRVADLYRETNIAGRNLTIAIESVTNMLSTVVTWGDSVDAKSNDHESSFVWNASTILAFAKIVKPAGGAAVLYFDFHAEMRRMLLSPLHYAKIDMEVIRACTTYRGLALYEICARYADNPSRVTYRRPWLDWVIPLRGSQPKGDKLEYRYFMRDTVHKAVAEVNELQSKFTVGVIEAGKLGTRTLQFSVIPRAKPIAEPDQGKRLKDLDQMRQVASLISIGLRQEQALQLVKKHQNKLHNLPQICDAVTRRLQKTGAEPVRNLQSYVSTLLAESDDRPYITDVAAKGDAQGASSTAAAKPQSRPMFSLRDEYLREKRAEMASVFYEAPGIFKLEQYRTFEEAGLPGMTELMKRSWRDFTSRLIREDIETLKIPKLIEYAFIDWFGEIRPNEVSTQEMELYLAAKGYQLSKNS